MKGLFRAEHLQYDQTSFLRKKHTLAKLGNSWGPDVPPTFIKAFEPLQAAQNKKYGSDVKVEKALKYGPHARNRIDVYSPASGATGRPVILYIHGGGLVTGDNDLTPNIYANIGNYFTANGCITCLSTYRLALQGGHHPDGAEDVRDALKWIQANIAQYGGDPTKVVAVGQSAGGYHLFSALALGYLDAGAGGGSGKSMLRAAVTLSAPFTVSVEQPERAQAMMDWFQTDKAHEVNARFGPLALFRQAFLGSAEKPGRDALPCELLLMVGELEADEILEGTWEFVAAYKARFGKLPLLEVLKGHNHITYCFGLGLDEPDYERVGKRLLGFVKEYTQ
ncbi:unnamed protein product [Discula destructiva]